MGLTLLRHTTPLVDLSLCYGRTELDVAPSFAEEAAAVLVELPPVDRIVSSPMLRCRKLADYLSEARGVSVEEDRRLVEMDFGDWEGQAWSDIPRAELDAWAADFLHARPHGGESVADLRARVSEALSEELARAERTVIVTHSGVIRVALSTGDTADGFSANIGFGGRVAIDRLNGETQ